MRKDNWLFFKTTQLTEKSLTNYLKLIILRATF